MKFNISIDLFIAFEEEAPNSPRYFSLQEFIQIGPRGRVCMFRAVVEVVGQSKQVAVSLIMVPYFWPFSPQ